MPVTHNHPVPNPGDPPETDAAASLRAAGLAHWSCDIEDERLFVHDPGAPRAEPLVIAGRQIVELAVEAAPRPFSHELSVVGPCGGVRRFRIIGGVASRDADGTPTALSGVAEDITAAARHSDGERNARLRAEAADRAKTEFLASMSHEIRTPMTSILGYAELLAEPGHPEERRAAFIDSIRRNGRHLLVIINDLLDLSRIEADRLHVECEPTDTTALIGDVCATLDARARAKGVALSCVLETPVPSTIRTDPTRLRQILINLIGNAIKFTDSGEVRVELSCVASVGDRRTLVIDVVDTGSGIPPETVGRLFEPYAQAEASTARTHGGSGLGLVISRRLARLLGGDVVVLRSVEGEGSVFRATIDSNCRAGEPTTDRLPERERSVAVGGEAPEPSSVRASGRVLLAEDGPDNQRLLSLLLRRTGVDVEIAEHGQAALDCVAASMSSGAGYDLILMDMQMPVMDGFEATRRLRERGWTGPIIALTAHALRRDREACLEAGCDDFAAKPIEARALVELVGRWLEEGRRRVERAA